MIKATVRRKGEQGQAIALFALVMFVGVLMFLFVTSYNLATSRAMEAVAAADLAAHAGAQEVEVRPDGLIVGTSRGAEVAARYWSANGLQYARLGSVSCGRYQGRPACIVNAQVFVEGFIMPDRWIDIQSVGYLANGVTRGDQ